MSCEDCFAAGECDGPCADFMRANDALLAAFTDDVEADELEAA